MCAMDVLDFARYFAALLLVLGLIGAGGMTYEEAALVCGTRVGTMKSRVARARIALRAVLHQRGPPHA